MDRGQIARILLSCTNGSVPLPYRICVRSYRGEVPKATFRERNPLTRCLTRQPWASTFKSPAECLFDGALYQLSKGMG